jgi:hypothetical protein
MPSRTAVYGVGAATGIIVGALVAQLNRGAGRDRLLRLLGRETAGTGAATHIVLPDWVSSLPEPNGEGVPDGRGAPLPLTSA